MGKRLEVQTSFYQTSFYPQGDHRGYQYRSLPVLRPDAPAPVVVKNKSPNLGLFCAHKTVAKGNCSATRCSVAAPPPGARLGFGGRMHPRHPPAVAERGATGAFGVGVAATPLLHTQNCGMSRDRGVATPWSATGGGGGVASAPLVPTKPSQRILQHSRPTETPTKTPTKTTPTKRPSGPLPLVAKSLRTDLNYLETTLKTLLPPREDGPSETIF